MILESFRFLADLPVPATEGAGGAGPESPDWLFGINPYVLLAGFIFSMIGLGAWSYGRRMEYWKPKLIGLLLMGYPYFVWNKYAVWLVGVGLCVLLWFQHDE